MKLGLNKKCPRCETKMATSLVVCPNCQLNFKKFNEATNAEAKKAIKEGNKDQVLLKKGYPADVKKWSLILITIFGGFLGAHYYRVGRYKMGLFFTIAFLIGCANAIINTLVEQSGSGVVWEIFTLLVLVWGAVLFMWIIDIAKVCLNQFKIPVSRS